MSVHTEFDNSSLLWVKSEIDGSLAQAREALQRYAAAADQDALRHAQTHLHQIYGALTLVELQGLARFCEETEQLVVLMSHEEHAEAASKLVVEALEEITHYLERLMAGGDNVPLVLFDLFRRMAALRGTNASGAELFFPSLSLVLPNGLPKSVLPADQAIAFYKQQRVRFESGLLRWLHGQPKGMQLMASSLASVASCQQVTIVRTFWWTAAGLLYGLENSQQQFDLDIKQILMRLNLQLRRLADGSVKVAERLFRDMLYLLAQVDTTALLTRHLQAAFELGDLFPSTEDVRESNMQAAGLVEARGLREDLRNIKEVWSRIAGGHRERISQLQHLLSQVSPRVAKLEAAALTKLWQGLVQALGRFEASHGPTEPEALEFATGLLLADNALAVYPHLHDDYGKQVDAILMRLESPGSDIALPQLDSVSQEAYEKLLLSQLAQEIRANLQQVEDILDQFFRSPQEGRDRLSELAAPMRQVQGALLMLECPVAVQLLVECEQRIEQYSGDGAPMPSQNELEELAEALSALGFFIGDMEQGRGDEARLRPILQRMTGVVEEIEQEDHTAMLESEPEPELAAAPVPAPVVEPVSPKPEQQAEPQVVPQAVVEEQAPPILPVAEAKPLPVSEAAIDAELLEVYLEEAVEVLGNIKKYADICRESTHDKEALTTIRRGYHTLKGSGRMVGLYKLGDVAWAIEQVMNKWLQDEKQATPELLDLVMSAHDAFEGWIAELKERGEVQVEASELVNRADRMRTGEEEPAPEMVAAPPGSLQAEVAASEVSGQPAADTSLDFSNNSEILIGDVAVSSTLFALFCEEAGRYLAALKHGVAHLHDTNEVENGFILAAHTLGGIASTAGFRKQGELAYALEHALQQLDADATAELPLMSLAVSCLDTMLNSIFLQQVPKEAPELISGLEAIRRKVSFGTGVADDFNGLSVSEGADADSDLSFELDDAVPEIHLEAEEIDSAPEASLPAFELPDLDLNLDGKAEEAESEEIEAVLPVEEIPLEDEASVEEITSTGFEPLPEFELPTLTEEEKPIELGDIPSLALDEVLLAELPQEQASEVVEEIAAPDLVFEDLPTNPELLATEEPEIIAIESEPFPEPLLEEPASVLDDLVIDTGDDDVPVVLDEITEAVSLEPEMAPVSQIAPQVLGTSPVSAAQQLAAAQAEMTEGLADEIDDQLLPLFIEEADELLPKVGSELHQLEDGSATPDTLKRIKRTLHTIKGSARMSGAMRMGEVAHRMETRMDDAGGVIDAPLLSQLESDYDYLLSLYDEVTGKTAANAAQPAQAPGAAAAPVGTAAPKVLLAGATEQEGQTIRVRSDLVDQLVNQAGEVAISRSRIDAEMLSLKGSLTDLTEFVTRLRSQLREIEIQAESQMQARAKEVQAHMGDFDPLEFDRFTRLQELTRFMAESVNDVTNVQQILLKSLDESNAALTAQARMTRDLQQSLMRVRLVPFGSVSERLYRLARQTGKEVGKKVNLEIKGASVEIDRGVLEKMVAPFEHMLRNAIDHGLEDPSSRLNLGKPDFGEVIFDVRQEGNELVILLKDDGRGLDLRRIREKAIEKGLIRADQSLSDQELGQVIFEAGFTTASAVTQLSGRGVGMDVVKNEISNLGGRIDLSTVPGEGTTFTIRLPLSLAVTQVLLVRAGERVIAIPSVMVEQVQEVKQDVLARLYDQREQEWLGQKYRFAYLPRLLGDNATNPEQKRFSTVLLLRSGSERMAMHIDELVKGLEVVVKPIGPQVSRIPGVVGATVLGTGEIVLIMNPLVLLGMAAQVAALAPQKLSADGEQTVVEAEELHISPVVMVVDDSLTVRKITGRLLEREGYQVVTAKDGVDALQSLQDVHPAVMLVDIEMPRMDGFELTRNIRANPDTKPIPIIMITSRTAEKHKNYAFELGVNVFLGKPYQEDELLNHIRHYVKEER